MKFLVLVTFSVLVYKAGVSGLEASDFVTDKECNVTKTFKVQRKIPYDEFSISDVSLQAEKLNIQKKFKTEEIEVNRTIPVCCDGYQSYDQYRCVPICTKKCGDRGICSAPEVCSCHDGYIFDEELQNCKPFCDSACETGICVAPNVCTCEEGYEWSQEASWVWGRRSTYDCKPICNNCTGEETCVEPHVCRCTDGYVRELMDRPDDLEVSQCKPICDKECVNGYCFAPNQCSCHENYTHIDSFTCDIRSYAISDFAVPKNCTKVVLGLGSQWAKRDEFHIFLYEKKILANITMPVCCDGYQNFDDERCVPMCTENCGIQGICSAPNVCTCNKGYAKDSELDECKPVCEHGCLNGHCIAPNTCACNDGYRKVLDFACAPICSQDCFLGTCTAPDTCTCRKGFRLSLENKFKCEPMRHKY